MKLSLIGGGGFRSILFTSSLLKRAEKLGIDEICYMDNDVSKLNTFGLMCIRLIERNGLKIKAFLTDSIDKAADNADYVVTTVRVGGDESRIFDERMALSLGVLGQETTGAGGFAMALRTIPILTEYCEKIFNANPDARVFNFTNPSGLVTQALRNSGYDNVVGICDSPQDMIRQIANVLKTNPKNLYVEFYGLNHLSWIKKIELDGRDVIRQIIEDKDTLKKIHALRAFEPELFQVIECIPNEYLYYYYHRERAINNIVASNKTRGEIVREINSSLMKELSTVNIQENPDRALEIYFKYNGKRSNTYMTVETSQPVHEETEAKAEDSEGYAGIALDVIESLSCENEHISVLSVPNDGSITGMNDDDVVEITCKIDKKGILPVKIGEIPLPMLYLMRQIKLFEQLTIRAIREKSKKIAYEALMIHPLVCSYSIAKKLVDGYLDAYEKYTGKWK
ncbi:MAG: hypothetical protein PWR06_2196 [Thermoanaerobacteraceae bacterium]|nr:hypothetical protein [Thermoanaerobacteraceae bacterium]MDK2943226.1 hypothetical protein [Acetobacterium sp.]MDN5301178.1 hypothetical protein [Thermoanaerobacteraceae bacterium]